VDVERARIADFVTDWIQEPKEMPWGNRSMLFRDPDGTSTRSTWSREVAMMNLAEYRGRAHGRHSRSLNIQPTITIRPGFPVRVLVTHDLVLEPYKS
jgi:hypothetical protein